MSGHWLAVASRDHVRCGLAGGFMQVCHGKAAPLRRLQPGDRVVYYSPTAVFGQGDPLQAFTAFGQVAAGMPYQVTMHDDFHPYRRDVVWLAADETPIRPLLSELDLAAGQRHWSYALRLGLLPLSEHDARLIAAAMGIDPASI